MVVTVFPRNVNSAINESYQALSITKDGCPDSYWDGFPHMLLHCSSVEFESAYLCLLHPWASMSLKPQVPFRRSKAVRTSRSTPSGDARYAHLHRELTKACGRPCTCASVGHDNKHSSTYVPSRGEKQIPIVCCRGSRW